MERKISISMVVTLLPALLLYLWKLTYNFSDWAALWLFLLAAMIFHGNWSIIIDHWKAEREIVLRPGSWISRRLTGRSGAFVSSAILVFALVPVLAWKALTMTILEAVIALIFAFVSACSFLWAKSFLAKHIVPPFDKIFATTLSSWLIGTLFSAILFLVTWHTIVVPAELLTATFPEAMSSAMGELQERRGWIAEVLAFGYAYEAGKLWLVTQMREYPLAAILFNLDVALFGFLAARASVVIAHFVETHYDEKPV